MKIPVPTKTIIIKGIEPRGISGVGKFFIKSKFPGKDHTVSKNGKPAKMITRTITIKNNIPRVDLFTITYLRFMKKFLKSFE
jgi:hypothetical protein